jgi:hypothetical protein
MFNRNKPKSNLELEIDRVLDQLKTQQPQSDEYEKLLERVTKLHKMKEEEKPSSVSHDTALLAATNIAGILLIISHERLHPITTKALGMLGRTR